MVRKQSHPKLRVLFRGVSLLLATVLLAALATVTEPLNRASPANAAMSNGVGFQVDDKWIGSFRDQSTSKNLWCVELGVPESHSNSYSNTIDTTALPSYFSDFSGVGAGTVSQGSSQYQRIGYLLSKYGSNPASNEQAAGLAMAIWDIRQEVSPAGGYISYFQAYKNALQLHSPSAMAQFNSMVAEAAAWWAAGAEVPGTGNPDADGMSIAKNGAYAGTVTVPAGATEVTLTNAVFESGNSNKLTWGGNGLANTTTYKWSGKPPSGWGRYYTVEAKGKYRHVENHYILPVTMNHPGQRVAGTPKHGNTVSNKNFSQKAITMDTMWAPELKTETVTKFVKDGENFSDTVTLYAATGGTYAPWRYDATSKKYAPIKAHGVLYGPFDKDPALDPKPQVPANAPVAGEATITTSEQTGPGIYSASTNVKATKAGYYTWVWSIALQDQTQSLKNPSGGELSLPDNYFYSDRFGEATEGQTVPMMFDITTEIDRDVVRLPNREFKDLVTLKVVNGNWLKTQNGKPVEVKVNLKAYGLNDKPVRQKKAPEGAVVISEGFATVNNAGTKTASEELQISRDAYDRYETLTVQACIRKEDQTNEVKNLIVESCDDWGVPSETVDIEWVPELSTRVESKFIDVGEELNDTVTFYAAGMTVAESAEYGWRKHPTTKNYLPVTAEGTLYGPFDYDPALNPSQEVPVWATGRIEAQTTITTDPEKGPGTYPLSMSKAREAGYYTWVWEIKSETQSDETVKRTIPVNYHYSDGFGTLGESLITSSSLLISTKLDREKVTLEERHIKDSVNVGLYDGQWLRGEDGKKIPANVRLTVYGVEGELERRATAPADAIEIARSNVEVTEQDVDFLSEAMDISIVDFARYDAVTVQACIYKEDQPEELQGYIKETCDEWGLPDESASLIKPEVTTQATPLAAVKSDISDTATVTGLPNGVEAEIEFLAYLKPEEGQPKYSANWEPVINTHGEIETWTAEEVQNEAAICEAQQVAKIGPVRIEDSGSYESPSVRAETAGTVYWVEELYVVNDEGEEPERVLFARGECGLPNETTFVEEPKITTQAVAYAEANQKIFDTALVEGPLSDREEIEYAVTFEAFALESEITPNEPDESLCTEETKIWESTKMTPVSKPGDYRSEKIKFPDRGVGHVLWVETLWEIEKHETGEEKRKINTGKCAEKSEITKIVPKKLAKTGAFAPTIGLASGVSMLLGGSMILLIGRRGL